MAEEKEEKKEPKKGSNKVLIIIIAILVVIIAGVGAFFAVTLYLPIYQENKAAEAAIEAERIANAKPQMGLTYVIGDFTVNPKGSKGRRFIVAQIIAEANSELIIAELTTREPQIRNGIIHYLRGKTVEEILDMDFQDQSAVDLKRMINERLNAGVVDSLYYSKFIVQ